MAFDSPENKPKSSPEAFIPETFIPETFIPGDFVTSNPLFDDANVVKMSPKLRKEFPNRPDIKDGDVLMVTWDQAMHLAKKYHWHIPTTRECAQIQNPDGLLEEKYVKKVLGGEVPEGYYKVSSKNGWKKDVFYFKNEDVQHTIGTNFAFWNASRGLTKREYAHVFYRDKGGGGGELEDHLRTKLHALVVLPEDGIPAKKR